MKSQYQSNNEKRNDVAMKILMTNINEKQYYLI